MSNAGEAEKWLVTLDTVIKRYRARLGGDMTEATLTLEQALEATRALKLSDGEAIAYLMPKPKRRYR